MLNLLEMLFGSIFLYLQSYYVSYAISYRFTRQFEMTLQGILCYCLQAFVQRAGYEYVRLELNATP
jgi:hypothetical protein